jgi:phage baseplate assembly protein W
MSTESLSYDIDLKFRPHPITKELKNLDELAAIGRAVNHILYTRKGEKLYNAEFGVGIQDYLFEINNFVLIDALKTNIENQIKNYEKRIIFEEISVEEDLHKIDISIYFRLKSSPREILVLDKTLKRIR